MKFYRLIAALALVCSPLSAFASGKGTTYADTFLQLDVSARAAALGGAYTALAADNFGMYYNPAGIAQTVQPEVGVSHTMWLEGMHNEYIGAIMPLWGWLALGVSGNYFSSGQIGETDENGNFTGSGFDSTGITAQGTAAIKIWKLSVGASMKQAREALGSYSTQVMLKDFGVMFRTKRFTLGAAVKNQGGANATLYQSSFKIPQIYRGGAAVTFADRLTITADAVRTDEESPVLCGGAEYLYLTGASKRDRTPVYFRLGYTSGRSKNTGAGISGGLGTVYHDNMNIDYAFVPYGDLGNTHRFSLAFRFGKARGEDELDMDEDSDLGDLDEAESSGSEELSDVDTADDSQQPPAELKDSEPAPSEEEPAKQSAAPSAETAPQSSLPVSSAESPAASSAVNDAAATSAAGAAAITPQQSSAANTASSSAAVKPADKTAESAAKTTTDSLVMPVSGTASKGGQESSSILSVISGDNSSRPVVLPSSTGGDMPVIQGLP